MLLSDVDIKKAMKKGEIRIDPSPSADQIGSGAVDVAISNEFWRQRDIRKKIMDLREITYEDIFEEIKAEAIILNPGELILAKTLEKISLAPNLCGWICGRSRYARLGISVYAASSFIHPGSQNRQVLEIINFSKFPFTLHSGMKICQIIFERTESGAEKPYSKIGKFAKQ